MVAEILRTGTIVVVPAFAAGAVWPLAWNSSRNRNQVARFFHRLQQYHCLATRYDKSVTPFLAFARCDAAFDWVL